MSMHAGNGTERMCCSHAPFSVRLLTCSSSLSFFNLQAHPLSLQLDVYKEATLTASSATKPPSVVISVLLQYLPALKVITAHCSNPGDNSLLKGLFPGDDGSGMPLEALAHRQGGAFRYSSSKAERPFRCAGVTAACAQQLLQQQGGWGFWCCHPEGPELMALTGSNNGFT